MRYAALRLQMRFQCALGALGTGGCVRLSGSRRAERRAAMLYERKSAAQCALKSLSVSTHYASRVLSACAVAVAVARGPERPSPCAHRCSAAERSPAAPDESSW